MCVPFVRTAVCDAVVEVEVERQQASTSRARIHPSREICRSLTRWTCVAAGGPKEPEQVEKGYLCSDTKEVVDHPRQCPCPGHKVRACVRALSPLHPLPFLRVPRASACPSGAVPRMALSSWRCGSGSVFEPVGLTPWYRVSCVVDGQVQTRRLVRVLPIRTQGRLRRSCICSGVGLLVLPRSTSFVKASLAHTNAHTPVYPPPRKTTVPRGKVQQNDRA
jgi:hypothetical protein